MSPPTSVTLLGPQRLQPIVVDALTRVATPGPVAAVTAGWQEREAEVDELQEHVRREVVNLRLHARADAAFEAHPELFEALRRRQDRLKDLQRIYRRRLNPLAQSARRLLRRDGPSDLLDPEREDALTLLRHLDSHHRRRIAEVHDRHEALWKARTDGWLARDLEELGEILQGATAVTIAGGHVAVLLNRLRLFRIPELLGKLPVIAWSAGAMACAEQVVLFHDRPPQGAGNAEILDRGLGLVPGTLPLPHAQARLKLEDPVRVALFARRFAPLAAITLDAGDSLDCQQPTLGAGIGAPMYGDGDTVGCRSDGAVRRLLPDGSLAPYPGTAALWRDGADWPRPPKSPPKVPAEVENGGEPAALRRSRHPTVRIANTPALKDIP